MIIIDTKYLKQCFNDDIIKELVGAYFLLVNGVNLGVFNVVDEIRPNEWNMQYKRNLYRIEFADGLYIFHYLKEM